MWGKKEIADAAKELADSLHVVEHVKALQIAQKELADGLRLMGERIRNLEIEMRVLKSETKLDAIKETQIIVNAVQGGLNQRIEAVAIKVALLETRNASKAIDGSTHPALTGSSQSFSSKMPAI